MPLTEYAFNVENPVDRIFYGRIDVKKASSFVFFKENNIVQRLIHHLKYRKQLQIGSFLGDWYGQILKEEDSVIRTMDFVVPVPLHRKKLRKRGYNQVSLFAERIAFHLTAEVAEDVLRKTANTRTQTKKGRLGRWQGDRALYVLENQTKLHNKKVLLVDDVITTGATMEICAKTLLQVPGIELYITSMAVVPLD